MPPARLLIAPVFDRAAQPPGDDGSDPLAKGIDCTLPLRHEQLELVRIDLHENAERLAGQRVHDGQRGQLSEVYEYFSMCDLG